MAPSNGSALRTPRRVGTSRLDAAEVDALVAASSPQCSTGLRNRALIHVIFRGGLRLGEALALACMDVDLTAGALHVAGVLGRSDRIVSVDGGATDALEVWLVCRRALGIADDAPLFCTLSGRPLHSSYVRQLLPRLARRAGITKKVSAEELRRAHAAELAARELPVEVVQARLGHSRRAVTRRYLSRGVPCSTTPAEESQPCATGPEDAQASLGLALDGMLILDAQGHVTDLNAAAEGLLGRAREDILGRGIWEVDPFANGTRALIECQRALRECRPMSFEFPDDLGVLHEARVYPMGEGCVVSLRDATQHGRAVDALCDSQERYRAIVETAVDAILTIDDRGVIESLNPAAERLFGYRADELVGTNVSVLMPEPYHSEHDGYLSRYRETGESHVIGVGREVLGRTKDGTTLPLHLAVGEMTIAGQRKFTGILQDISERTRVEEELRRIEVRTRILEEQAALRRVATAVARSG